MTWDPKAGVLRCDASWYTGRREPCHGIVPARSRALALLAADLQGWRRGRRAGSRTDLCVLHRDGTGL